MSGYEPMNTAELMDRVFDVYKASFKKQLAFSAVISVISFVFMVILGVAAAVSVITPALDNPDAAIISMFIAMLGTMLPIYWIWTATADAGHILLSQQAFYKRQVKLPAKKLPRVVLRVLGATLAQIILSIPWLLLVGAFIYLLARSDFSTLGLGLWLGDPMSFLSAFTTNRWLLISILGALVYIAYSNIFSLAVPAAVFERCSLFKAIARSWRLIKGEFWKILGIRILWSVTVYMFTYSAQGLWALVTTLLNTTADSALGTAFLFNTVGSLLQSLVSIAISFIFGPLSGIMTALIYFNQRIKKEGLDLEIALEKAYESL